MKTYLFSVLSGLLLIASFQWYEITLLAWLSLIPLLIMIKGQSAVKGFGLFLVCGIVFWSGHVYWLVNVPKYTLLHYLILMPYLGLFFGLFGLIFCFVQGRVGITAGLAAAPFIWVSLDYLRSHISWLSLPWGMLAHSQHQNLPIIQISAYTGAYGVTFLIIAVNSAVTIAMLMVRGADNPIPCKIRPKTIIQRLSE